MFLSSCLLLVPMIFAFEIKVQNDSYVVKIKNDYLNTLKNIQNIGEPSDKLNLSGLSLHRINNTAFDNVSHLKILNLSSNSLSALLANTFVRLTNLEELYISHNNIFHLRSPFVGLSNLKILDLSNNMLKLLRPGEFFGLTKSCVILLKGNAMSSMSTELFENKLRALNSFGVDDTEDYSDKDANNRGPSIFIKICMNDTKLILVEHYTEGEKLASGCIKDKLYAGGVLSLGLMGIAGFQKDWFKLGDLSIRHIDLSINYIARLTGDMFNDLPESISIVNLELNYMERLEKGIIVNEHLREMHFTSNSIIEIEDNVFINTNLTTLNLSHNLLMDTKFAATLPPTLTKIYLQYNEIAEISSESFSKLNKLEVLVLNNNRITEIHRDSLRDLLSLKNLSLVDNGLMQIEAGSFKGLAALEILRLEFNDITELESGVFADLKNIKKIVLGWNGLSNLTGDSLINLPDSLETLDLQYNFLETLKTGTFVNSPKYKLLLNNNNISNIENGCFDLPHLQSLVLTNNFLSVIDSGTFRSSKNLQRLWLDGNKIMRIEKGSFGSLKNLCKLVMSSNPIKRLENGALHGLLQKRGCHVKLKYVPIEVIHGGVFAGDADSSFDRLSEINNTILKVL